MEETITIREVIDQSLDQQYREILDLEIPKSLYNYSLNSGTFISKIIEETMQDIFFGGTHEETLIKSLLAFRDLRENLGDLEWQYSYTKGEEYLRGRTWRTEDQGAIFFYFAFQLENATISLEGIQKVNSEKEEIWHQKVSYSNLSAQEFQDKLEEY